MQKRVIYFLLLVFVAGILATCKKYPEGPCVSLRSKKERVCADWNVEAFTVNGVDSLSTLTCKQYAFYSKEGNPHISAPTCTNTGSGDWYFENHHTELKIYFSLDSTAKTPFPISDFSGSYSSNLSWKIQRLTNNHMWLKTNYNGNEYYTKFNKISE